MRALMALTLCMALSPVFATTAELTAVENQRYTALIEELRCLVCQNQNIAESNAPLAEDLKQQVKDMIQDGRSDTQIKDYLIARYGDFVLYRPPFKPLTWLLWLGPFLLLLLGLLIAWRVFSGKGETETTVVDHDALDALLKADAHDDKDEVK